MDPANNLETNFFAEFETLAVLTTRSDAHISRFDNFHANINDNDYFTPSACGIIIL